jgi:hypothetical protein
MAINIIMVVIERWKEIDSAEGLVLVDELEVHLHPIWKMEIVSLLRQVFPKLMFLVTTHDPLCLRGLQPGEVTVLRCSEDKIEAHVITESLAHLRADQLLTSPLFGLLGTREPSESSKLKEIAKKYDELFAKPIRTPEEEGELNLLRAQITERTPSGESVESRFVENTVHQVVQSLAAQPLPEIPRSAIEPLVGAETAKTAIREKIAELLGQRVK